MFQWLYKKRANNIIILDKDRAIYNGDIKNGFDVVITPSFYWFTKRVLPVKFVFQVKEYLPSIFEEMDAPANLSYQVIKKDDEFWLFGYDDASIVEELKKQHIDPSLAHKIYFAQNVFDKNDTVDIGNGYKLINIQDTVSKVPSSLTTKEGKDAKDFIKNGVKLENGVVLKRYKNVVDEKIIRKVMIPLIIIIALQIAQLIKIYIDNKKLTSQRENIFTKYDLPPTTFQNRAILSRLKQKSTKQNAIREFLSMIFQLPLQRKEYVSKIEISSNRAKISIKLTNSSRAEIFKNYLLKTHKFQDLDKIVVKDGLMSAEVTL